MNHRTESTFVRSMMQAMETFEQRIQSGEVTLEATEAALGAPTENHSSMQLKFNRLEERFFAQPIGEDFITWHIHPRGDQILRKYGIRTGGIVTTRAYIELRDGGFLYFKHSDDSKMLSKRELIDKMIRSSILDYEPPVLPAASDNPVSESFEVKIEMVRRRRDAKLKRGKPEPERSESDALIQRLRALGRPENLSDMFKLMAEEAAAKGQESGRSKSATKKE
jgi:hypothetical protein